MDPIAYTYEADWHCPDCAIERFGREPGTSWVRDDAIDSEGNPIGALAPWDEVLDSLYCGTCGELIYEMPREEWDDGH